MNKQALTFLSLFSLILVLSVYYMLLPEKEVSVSASQSVIEQLQNDLDKRREQIELKNQEIIASQTSTTESIKLALTLIEENKQQSEMEKKINNLIKNIGYSDVCTEINDTIVEVTIVKKDAQKSDASSVINTVLNEIGSTYQVQVKFIEQ